jgi:uncharacterized membrane protein YkvA (DUF1232 family)
MDTWQIVLLSLLATAVVALIAAWIAWRAASARTRALARRVQRLPWQLKFRLAAQVIADERTPPGTRLVLAAMAMYLAMPLDLIPDFVPVLGQIDDMVVVLVGAGLLIRSASLRVLEDHLADLEGLSSR